MTILDRIKTESLAARKSGDKVKAKILVTLIGEANTKEKNLQPARAISDAEVVALINTMIKNNDITIDALSSHDNNEKAIDDLATLNREKEILDSFRPKQMTDDELGKAIYQYTQTGAADMKSIMERLKADFPGCYDGKSAARIAKSLV